MWLSGVRTGNFHFLQRQDIPDFEIDSTPRSSDGKPGSQSAEGFTSEDQDADEETQGGWRKESMCARKPSERHAPCRSLKAREGAVNWSEIQTDWDRMRGLLQAHWPNLTAANLSAINGDRVALARYLKHAYKVSDPQAENMIAAFEKDCRRPGAAK